MKKITKLIVLLLTLCQIAGCFAACKKDAEGTEDSSEPAFDLTVEQLSEYKLVIPHTTQTTMRSVATKLQGMIEKVTGAKPEIKTDKIVENSEATHETEYEILVGYADRAEAYEFYADVKKDDYGYALVGKKILILGHDDAMAEKSVTQFKVNVLDKAGDSGVILAAGDSKVQRGSYSYDTLTLNGTDIGKFKIVYPVTAIKGEPEVASDLRDWISDKTGHVLPIVTDDKTAGEYEIHVGDTSRIPEDMSATREAAGYNNQKSYIGVSDKTVWICGSTQTLLNQAMGRLLKSAEYDGKAVTLKASESGCVTFTGEFSLTVMSYNVYFDLSESQRNADDVIVSVNQKAPDIFGLNEAGLAWINKFKADSDISAVYGCAEGKALETASDASYNPIFYRKDRFELIEVTTKWLSSTPDKMSKDPDAKHYKGITYAVFKDKATGTEFMYMNTHLDGSGDQDAHQSMKDLRKRQAEIVKRYVKKYPFMPIIVGGDFNEGPTSAVIGGMSTNTRLKYCMSIADTSININSTDTDSTFTSITGGVVFDYLFVTADCITVQKYEQWDNKINGKYPSDHLPVYAEITIKY